MVTCQPACRNRLAHAVLSLDGIMPILDGSTRTRVAMSGIHIQWVPAKALSSSWCILARQSRTNEWQVKAKPECAPQRSIGDESTPRELARGTVDMETGTGVVNL
eukprot:6471691-Amphidinium_carterae.3